MAETVGEWKLMAPGWVALDDLRDQADRNWKIYADSCAGLVHHVALAMSREDAELVVRAVKWYREVCDDGGGDGGDGDGGGAVGCADE